MQEKREKTRLEELAEMLDALPDEGRELVAAQLLGVMQGVLLATAIDAPLTA